MMSVSKVWYKTYNMKSKSIDQLIWKYFVNVGLGGLRKSPGCKTYRDTWLARMRGICLSCRTHTSAKFGTICPEVSAWVVVCEKCQSSGHAFYRVVSESRALALGARSHHLDNVPFKWRTDDDSHNPYSRKNWYKQYWKKSVLKAIEVGVVQDEIDRVRRIEEERVAKIEREAAEKRAKEERIKAKKLAAEKLVKDTEARIEAFNGDKVALRRGLKDFEAKAYPISPKMNKLVEEALAAITTVPESHLNEIIAYEKRILDTMDSVTDALEDVGIDADDVQLLSDLVDKDNPRARRVWIDSLIGKTVSLKKYVSAAQIEAKKMKKTKAKRDKEPSPEI